MSSATNKWTRSAALIVGFCFLTNMVDGMDVNIMSYVRGSISKEWGVADDIMSYVLSAGTLGMGFGALGIAPFADKFGRKPIILAALALMSVGMIASGIVNSVEMLMAARFVVGLGIGTVLAAMAALAAESAPAGKKDMAVGLVQAGFPLAAVGTGFVIAAAMPVFGWQHMLLWAGLVTVIMIPAAWAVLPETLPERSGDAAKANLGRLFQSDLKAKTIFLIIAVFMGLLVLYSMLSWITKLATSAGLSEANSIYAGASYNMGAFLGTTSMGLLSRKFRPTTLLPILLSLAGIAMLTFGYASMSLSGALAMAFIIGVTLQGGYNAMWPIAAGAFSEETRATGIGWVMGIGRGGAVVGPIMAGYLLKAEMSLGSILATYCVPLAICAFCAFSVGRIQGGEEK